MEQVCSTVGLVGRHTHMYSYVMAEHAAGQVGLHNPYFSPIFGMNSDQCADLVELRCALSRAARKNELRWHHGLLAQVGGVALP